MESIEIYKYALDNLSVGASIFNQRGDFIYVNSAQLGRSYYTYKDYMSMNVHEVYQSASDVCPFDLACASKKPITVIQNTYHEHGQNYRKLVTATPILDDNGEILYVVHTYIDLEVFQNQFSQAQQMCTNSVSVPENALLQHPDIIYRSAAIQNLIDTILSIADADSSILLFGESGTGKEVFADFVHNHSSRANKDMVTINCASLPESLLEAELFGYEKGAFTGAAPNGKAGLFEAAEGSTLFLDEINSMPLSLQGKVLRAIENKRIKRIGSIKEIPVDFRIISATNEDLKKCISAGTFRPDLYYRLNVIPLVIPPLRQRPDDIIPLANFFLQTFYEKYGKRKTLSPHAFKTLMDYHWPGNVRELRNFIERLVVTSGYPSTEINYIPRDLLGDGFILNAEEKPLSKKNAKEIDLIADALRRSKGNRQIAADLLGISRRTLQYKLKEYHIQTELEPKIYINGQPY